MTRAWTTADDMAADLRDMLAADDVPGAIRMLMDGVNRLPAALAAGELDRALAEPSSTGSIRWDTLLAAAVRYRLHQMGHRAPAWTLKEPLAKFWWPLRVNASKEFNDMVHSPAELIRVGIFMDERGFQSA